jgi:general secretion pathway protein K
MKPRYPNRRRQRGVALIIALILVSLATILAWKVSFDGYLERRRSFGVLGADQAIQFGLGAEALAADVLARDAQTTKQTTLNSEWAQPTPALPLSAGSDPNAEPFGSCRAAWKICKGASI